MPDTSGPVATDRDSSYSLTIDQAAELYFRAGHPRTVRSIQRYCGSGHLDCVKEATTLGDKFFVNPDSVARHIAQIEELIALDNRASRRGVSRPSTTHVAHFVGAQSDSFREISSRLVATDKPEGGRNFGGDSERQPATSDDPRSRPVATADPATSPHVAQIERELERAHCDTEFLREQIKTKDTQIAALLERDRETNILVGSLQKMLAPLLGLPQQNHRNGDSSAAGFSE